MKLFTILVLILSLQLCNAVGRRRNAAIANQGYPAPVCTPSTANERISSSLETMQTEESYEDYSIEDTNLYADEEEIKQSRSLLFVGLRKKHAPLHASASDFAIEEGDRRSRALEPLSMTTSPSPSSSSTTLEPSSCCLSCPMCDCEEQKEELEKEIEALEEQIEALDDAMDWMDDKVKEINAAQDALLGEFDNFEVKIAGRCFLAGVEALAVGKLVKALRPACVEVGFAAECLSVGLNTKEVIKYLWKNKDVSNAIFSFGTETATIIAKTQTGDQGLIKYIPIIGGWCEAYDWSDKLFNAPELIEMLGDQITEANALKLQLKTLKDDKTNALEEKQAQLEALPCYP